MLGHGDPGPWPWKMLDLLEVSDDGFVMVRHLKFGFLVRFQQQAQVGARETHILTRCAQKETWGTPSTHHHNYLRMVFVYLFF